MRNSTALLKENGDSVAVSDLKAHIQRWLLDTQLSDRSPKTLKSRRDILGKLQWFLSHRQFTACGVEELREFFLYLTISHNEPGGRWGNPTEITPLRPQTLKTYYALLRGFFNYLVSEGCIGTSPISRIPSPKDRPDEVQPFTDADIDALMRQSGKGRNKTRDTTILLLLLDTGLRASELCSLLFSDVDFMNLSITVRQGKGKKTRYVPIGKTVTRALFSYCKDDGRDDRDPLFISERGDGFSYNTLANLFKRLGKGAGVPHCHPHRLRHTFAVNFLRNGGNQFALQKMLGHSSLEITRRYVQLCSADIADQHRQYSPADAWKGKKNR